MCFQQSAKNEIMLQVFRALIPSLTIFILAFCRKEKTEKVMQLDVDAFNGLLNSLISHLKLANSPTIVILNPVHQNLKYGYRLATQHSATYCHRLIISVSPHLLPFS
jgi:hypothetical protein